MDDLIQYVWQQTLLDAFLSDAADVAVKVKIAERTISDRLRASRPIDSAEQMALGDALRALKVLVAEANAEAAENRRAEERRTRTPATSVTAHAF